MQTETASVRTYQPEDKPKLEHLIEVMNAADLSLQAEEFMLVAGFPNHDPLTDSFVLEVADQIVGYGWVGGSRLDRNDCWIAVAPEHRRKGYGKLLLERILERASQRQASGLLAYLSAVNPRSSSPDTLDLKSKDIFVSCTCSPKLGENRPRFRTAGHSSLTANPWTLNVMLESWMPVTPTSGVTASQAQT
jgi:GNAT superfamily N-acetyltransferase